MPKKPVTTAAGPGVRSPNVGSGYLTGFAGKMRGGIADLINNQEPGTKDQWLLTPADLQCKRQIDNRGRALYVSSSF